MHGVVKNSFVRFIGSAEHECRICLPSASFIVGAVFSTRAYLKSLFSMENHPRRYCEKEMPKPMNGCFIHLLTILSPYQHQPCIEVHHELAQVLSMPMLSRLGRTPVRRQLQPEVLCTTQACSSVHVSTFQNLCTHQSLMPCRTYLTQKKLPDQQAPLLYCEG
jgi:hypothetical protein